jgi:N-acetylglucosaminyldiphosphoundecaprenol N-acetyl-beta-D-mannosaminyltransferase
MPHQISDLPVPAMTFREAVETLYAWAHDSKTRYVSTCTVYTLMRAMEDDLIFAALQEADMITADGMPLVWLQRRQGFRHAERVYGPDVMLALCELTRGNSKVSHYLYGGLPGVPEELAEVLMERFEGINIAGTFSPPLADIEDTPDEEVVRKLNESGASIIWVGLGSPKQDLWMRLYRPALNAPLLIGVGAAFDFISGTKLQAPVWMRRRGLEWLFRLLQEPRRLWHRYLVYNLRFLGAIFRLYRK